MKRIYKLFALCILHLSIVMSACSSPAGINNMTQDVFEKKMDSIVAAKYIVVRKNLQSDYKFRWNILLKAKVDSILGIAVPARVDSVSIPSDFTNQISTNNENETSDTSDQ